MQLHLDNQFAFNQVFPRVTTMIAVVVRVINLF